MEEVRDECESLIDQGVLSEAGTKGDNCADVQNLGGAAGVPEAHQPQTCLSSIFLPPVSLQPGKLHPLSFSSPNPHPQHMHNPLPILFFNQSHSRGHLSSYLLYRLGFLYVYGVGKSNN